MADRLESAEALAVARDAAAHAVRVLLDRLAGSDAGGAERKQARDFVTVADEAAETVIVERLERAFPDHAIVAEESGGRDRASPWRWLVDPLDGTTNFVHAFPVFAVSIALFRDETPVLGLVVDVGVAVTAVVVVVMVGVGRGGSLRGVGGVVRPDVDVVGQAGAEEGVGEDGEDDQGTVRHGRRGGFWARRGGKVKSRRKL